MLICSAPRLHCAALRSVVATIVLAGAPALSYAPLPFVPLSFAPTASALRAPTALGAQVLVVDEGTFSLFRDGTRIGREDFSIRRMRSTADGEFVAQANQLEGEGRLTLVLNTDAAGTPLRFRLERREATQLVATIAGEQLRGIWSGRALHETGETAREFRLPPDTFLAESGIIHQLWFVLQFGEGRPIVLLDPSGPTQSRVVLEEQAPDRVALGLRELLARRWLARDADSGDVIWEIWTDSSGRLLRALHPALALEALRDDPPAETRPSGRS